MLSRWCGATDLEAVVRPRREEHRAVLLVEREVLDVDGARAAEDDHRQPRHVAVRRHDDVCTDRRLVRRHVGAVSARVNFKWYNGQLYCSSMCRFNRHDTTALSGVHIGMQRNAPQDNARRGTASGVIAALGDKQILCWLNLSIGIAVNSIRDTFHHIFDNTYTFNK